MTRALCCARFASLSFVLQTDALPFQVNDLQAYLRKHDTTWVEARGAAASSATAHNAAVHNRILAEKIVSQEARSRAPHSSKQVRK